MILSEGASRSVAVVLIVGASGSVVIVLGVGASGSLPVVIVAVVVIECTTWLEISNRGCSPLFGSFSSPVL